MSHEEHILAGRLLDDPWQPPGLGWIRISGGRIVERDEGSPPDHGPILGGDDALIVPGFVDAHTHLPQIGQAGCDGLELLDWLDRIIFPAESTWRDPACSIQGMVGAIDRMLRGGTLGFAGYLTSHPHVVEQFTTTHSNLPLRTIIGQVLMDQRAPADLLHHPLTLPDRRDETGRLDWSITPRFAVGCSDALLASLQEPAKDRFVQTHLAETRAECDLVAQDHPNLPHYAAVYDEFGLLHERTLLAHALHLTKDEWALVAERRSMIVHCPTANTFLEAGIFDLRAACEHGVRVLLGSDVAAGPDISMPRVARAMIEVAKLRRMTVDDKALVPTPTEAWLMITRSNAAALGWADHGRLAVGDAADLLVLTPNVPHDEHLIGRLLYGWDDAWIRHRIVCGRVRHPSAAPPAAQPYTTPT